MMLTRLAIKNFKSIGDPGLDLELKPLTLLVGPNGAGKSSVLEALAFCIQNALVSGNLTSGTYFPFSSPAELVSRTGETIGSEIQVTTYENSLGVVLTVPLGQGGVRSDFVGAEGISSPKETTFGLKLRAPQGWYFPITAYRGQIPAKYNAGGLTTWVGLKGENLPIVEHKLQENYDLYRSARRWGAKFALSEATSEWLGGNELRSAFRDSELGGELQKAVASYGAQQAWVIVVQLHACKSGSLVTIEEPEISLHPQAQVDMAELLATAAAEGKQILATTHSTFLLMGLGKAIRKGIIPAKDVAIYEITKGPEGSKEKRLHLNEKGHIRDWADTWFGKVELALLSEWSNDLAEV